MEEVAGPPQAVADEAAALQALRLLHLPPAVAAELASAMVAEVAAGDTALLLEA